MNISQLEKLTKNPYYKLSAVQLAELEAHRKSNVRHNPVVKKHNTNVVKHSTKLEDENGTR